MREINRTAQAWFIGNAGLWAIRNCNDNSFGLVLPDGLELMVRWSSAYGIWRGIERDYLIMQPSVFDSFNLFSHTVNVDDLNAEDAKFSGGRWVDVVTMCNRLR